MAFVFGIHVGFVGECAFAVTATKVWRRQVGILTVATLYMAELMDLRSKPQILHCPLNASWQLLIFCTLYRTCT